MRKTLKHLIEALPMKRAFFSALRGIYTPPHALYKHLHFTGEFSTVVDGKTLRLVHYGYEVENEIFWSGLTAGWEGVSMSLWIELCRRSRFILDIGANTGIYSLVAKTVNPSAEVFAFEPVGRVYEKLKRNCELNHYDVHCVRKALSNYDGTAVIYDPQGEHVYSVTVNENLNPPNIPTVKVEVETLRLATFLESFAELPRLDLMKLDVETHEPAVLEGMGPYLARLRPAMLVEVLSDDAAGRVERLVQGMDYLYFNIDEKGKPKRQAHITKSGHFNFLVCSESDALSLRLL